jgi:hypothetical protein
MHKTFFNWNLMVDLTSLILALKSSLWETGVGNLPAAVDVSARNRPLRKHRHTLRETGTQETRNLLDQSVGSDEGIVLAGELLDQLLVLVELLQVIGGHGINTTVLGTIDIMLITENAIPSKSARALSVHVCDDDLPDAHTRAGNNGQTDGSRETLVTLGIIVLEADLEFDGFEEVSLLGLERVFEKLLDVGTHSGCGAKMSVDAHD